MDKSDQRVLKRRQEKMGRHPRKTHAGFPIEGRKIFPNPWLNHSEPPEKEEIGLSASGAGSGTADGVLAGGDKFKAKKSHKESEKLSTFICREKLRDDPEWQALLEGIGVRWQAGF